MITDLQNKIKYQEIINNVISTQRSLVSSFNGRLKTLYEDFKSKITEHKTTLEKKIKQYIEKIKEDLDKNSSCIDKLIESICKDLKNLKTNQSKLKKFDNYDSKEKLAQTCTYLDRNRSKNFQEIVETHEKYKECLKSSTEITNKLEDLRNTLQEIKDCSKELSNKLEKYSSELPSTTNIDEVLESLQSLKSKHVDKLNVDDACFQKLQEIDGYITTMKTELKQVEDKVIEKAKDYINGLKDISIKEDDVKQKIEEITKTTDLIINQLNIAKSASCFYKSLEDEVGKISGVNFTNYDISEFYKNSRDIKGKLTTFQTTIDSKLTNTTEAIQKSEQEIQALKKSCPGPQEQPVSENDKLLSCELKELQEYYTSEIPKIKSLKENFLAKITIINDVLTFLENNKNQSVTYIKDIKCQVCSITDLNDATTKLPNIKEDLNKFVKLQQTTKSLISDFSGYSILRSLNRYSDKLQDSINTSLRLVGLIDYYKGYLITVEHVDSIVSCIKSSYRPIFEKIKQILDNFKEYVTGITINLCSINQNLFLLKCDIDKCCPSYKNSGPVNKDDFYKMKDYMKNLKLYLRKIKTDFTTIKTLFDKIEQESLYIDQNECYLEYLKWVIDCYTKCNKKQGPEKAVIDYLKSIKDRIKEILTIKYLITEHSNMTKISKIDSRLKGVEQSINKLEFAIEGVARNMIRCFLQEVSNYITNCNNSN